MQHWDTFQAWGVHPRFGKLPNCTVSYCWTGLTVCLQTALSCLVPKQCSTQMPHSAMSCLLTSRSRKLPGCTPLRSFLLPVTCLARSDGLLLADLKVPGVRGAAQPAAVSSAVGLSYHACVCYTAEAWCISRIGRPMFLEMAHQAHAALMLPRASGRERVGRWVCMQMGASWGLTATAPGNHAGTGRCRRGHGGDCCRLALAHL